MRIFAAVPWKEGVSEVIENVVFGAFGRYIFGVLRTEANIII